MNQVNPTAEDHSVFVLHILNCIGHHPVNMDLLQYYTSCSADARALDASRGRYSFILSSRAFPLRLVCVLFCVHEGSRENMC